MQHIDSIVDLIQDTESRFKNRTSTREKARRSFESKDFAGANEERAIEARLKHLGVDEEVNEKLRSESFEIPGRTPNQDTRATIENVVLERILGENDLMPIAYLMAGQNRAKTVGRVLVKDRMGRLTSYGTGFMVSPNLLMTNNHVLETDAQAANSEIQFDYELDVKNREVTTSSFRFDPSTFFLTNEQLDFSLVAVSPNGDTKPSDWGWNQIPESDDGLIVKGEYVSIIQHPNGEMKQIALRENQILDFFDEFLHYKTDTAPGSSGSPVFNDQWEIVALHHSGVPERDQSGNIIAVDGRIWKKWMGDHRIKWIANEGIAIGRIVQFIKSSSGLSDSQRKVRDGMFSESSPTVGGSAIVATPASPPRHTGEAGSKNQSPKLLQNASSATSTNGSSTWTIPIQITVDLGQPQQQSGSYTATVAAQPMAGASTSSTSVQPVDDADLRKALADFENAASREYYDEEKDEEDREEYYSEIDASSFSKKKMYEELNSLLKSTHITRPKYKPRVHVYPWVDLHPDLELRSIYSGKTFSAEEVIREDMRIEQERMQMIQELSLRESTMSHEAFEEAVSLLESQNPFNCEHVVPQSWFGKKEPEKGDLHHLFTCESGCNSFRSNIAYFDFADFEEALRTDCGKREDNKFEPSAGKGAVARATLYFLLRYKGKIESPSEFPKDRISILLQWHADHPVDEYERHRNQAIFEKQGNRNPLIDFPEWAGKIKFDLGIG